MASKKPNNDSKIVTGVIIGGVIGVSALAIYLATRNGQAPLNRIGETIARVGEIFEEHDIEQPAALKMAGKKIHKNENTIVEVLDWVATGLDLWKKIKN